MGISVSITWEPMLVHVPAVNNSGLGKLEHARVTAALSLGLEVVPVIRVDFMTQADKRAFALAENRLAELGSWDKEISDYSAFIIARVFGKTIHIIDVVRARLQFPALKARTIELARLHGAKVLLIEDAASGQQLIQSLRAEEPRGVPSPIARRPEGDKVSRVIGVTAMIEAGRLHLPQSADWLGDYTAELLGFPTSRYDDQVDATAQLLIWVQEQDMFRAPEIAGPIEMTDGEPDDPEGLWIGDPWGA